MNPTESTPSATGTASSPAASVAAPVPSAKAPKAPKAPEARASLAPFIAIVMAAPRPTVNPKATIDGVLTWGKQTGCPVADMAEHRDAVLSRLGASVAKTSFTASGTKTSVTAAIVKAYSDVAKHYAKDDRRAESSASAYRQAKRAFAVLAAITEASESTVTF